MVFMLYQSRLKWKTLELIETTSLDRVTLEKGKNLSQLIFIRFVRRPPFPIYSDLHRLGSLFRFKVAPNFSHVRVHRKPQELR